jgi:phage-related protein
VRNATVNVDLFVDGVSLAAGEYIDIDMLNRTVVKNDGSNLYSRVRFPTSVWWLLQPGANTIELRSGSTTSTATLAVTYRDVWV